LLALLSTFGSVVAYLVDFFQHQRTDSPILIFDVYLAELVPVSSDRADFANSVLVAHPVKEIVDPPWRGLFERMVWVDVHHLAVPSKVPWSVGGPMEHKGKGIRRTLSIDLPFYSCVIQWTPRKDP